MKMTGERGQDGKWEQDCFQIVRMLHKLYMAVQWVFVNSSFYHSNSLEMCQSTSIVSVNIDFTQCTLQKDNLSH